MPSLAWALTCRRVIIDQQSNFISYVDALDGFNVPTVPFPCPLIVLCTLWFRSKPEDERIELRAVIRAPSGAIVNTAVGDPLVLTSAFTRARVNVGFGGFPLPQTGVYHVGIEIRNGDEWRQVHEVPFEVALVSNEYAHSATEPKQAASVKRQASARAKAG